MAESIGFSIAKSSKAGPQPNEHEAPSHRPGELSETSARNDSAKTFGGASYLIFFTVLHKLATFAMNQVVVSYVSTRVFGFCTVQLEGVILQTTLFLSREPFRLALLRNSEPSSNTADSLSEKLESKRLTMRRLVNAAW